MTADVILSGLQEVFNQVFVNSVTVTASLSAVNVPEWDSVMHIKLLIMIEKKFSIRFRMGEVAQAKNIAQLIELISKHLGTKGSNAV